MYKYSYKSNSRLITCHKDIQTIFNLAIKYIDISILEGHRPEKKQNKNFYSGKSKVKWPNGKHNSLPSKAIDATPYPVPKGWGQGSRDELEKFRYMAFYLIGLADALYEEGAISHRLRWGGDWDKDHDILDQTFEDLVHFELY